MIRDKRHTADDASTQPIDLPLFPDALEEEDALEDEARTESATKARSTPAREREPREVSPSSGPSYAASRATEEVEVAQVELPIDLISSDDEASVDLSGPQPASLLGRVKATLLDLGAMLGVLAILLAGGALLGAPSGLAALPFYLPTWVVFSFLYHVVPLIFWGRTPGMVMAGLTARTTDGESMTGAQAVRRWLGSQLTLLLLGLPGLVAFSGRSLADRTSGTVTRTS